MKFLQAQFQKVKEGKITDRGVLQYLLPLYNLDTVTFQSDLKQFELYERSLRHQEESLGEASSLPNRVLGSPQVHCTRSIDAAVGPKFIFLRDFCSPSTQVSLTESMDLMHLLLKLETSSHGKGD